MEFPKITPRGQMTIASRDRESAYLAEGDGIVSAIESDHLRACQATSGPDDYLDGLCKYLSEWNSPEDEEAWRDL